MSKANQEEDAREAEEKSKRASRQMVVDAARSKFLKCDVCENHLQMIVREYAFVRGEDQFGVEDIRHVYCVPIRQLRMDLDVVSRSQVAFVQQLNQLKNDVSILFRKISAPGPIRRLKDRVRGRALEALSKVLSDLREKIDE